MSAANARDRTSGPHPLGRPGHPSAGTYIPVGDPSAKRRRPSGASPPLPRRLGTTGKGWLVALVVLVAWVALMNASSTPRRVTDHIDAAVLRAIAAVRNDWMSPWRAPSTAWQRAG